MVSQTSDELIPESVKATWDLAMTLGSSTKGPQTWTFEILGCT